MEDIDRQNMVDDILEFMCNSFPKAKAESLSPTDPIIGSGIIDSLGLLTLISHIEAEYGIMVSDTDVDEANFLNIERVTDYIVRSQTALEGCRS